MRALASVSFALFFAVACGDRAAPPVSAGPTDFALAVEAIDSAIATLEARVEAQPGDVVTLEQLSAQWSRRARFTGQIEDYETADQILEKAYEAAGAAKPWRSRAVLSYTLHRLDQSEEALDSLEAIPLLSGGSRGENLGLRGDIAYHRSQYADALALYEESLDVEVTVASAFRLALYYANTGQPEQASAFLAMARAQASSSDNYIQAWLTFQEGVMALERDELDEARRLFTAANERFTGWYLIEEHLAEVNTLQGRYLEAERAYRDIVRRTNLPEFMDALAGVLEAQGNTAEAQQFRDQARAGFEDQLVRLPSAASGHALDHFLENGDPSRAVAVALENLSRRPNGEAKLKLARAYALTGASEALAPLQEVLESPFRTLELNETCEAVIEALSLGQEHPITTGCGQL